MAAILDAARAARVKGALHGALRAAAARQEAEREHEPLVGDRAVVPGVHGDGGEVAAVNEPLEVRRAAVETQSEGEQVRGDDDLQLGVEGDDEAVREHVEERAVLGRAEQVGNGRARHLRRRRSREVNGPEAAVGVARAQVPDDVARLRLEAVLADGNEPGPPAGCRAGGRIVTGPSLEVGYDVSDRVRDLDDGPVVEDVGDVTRAERGLLRRGVVDRLGLEHWRVLRERQVEERGVVEGLWRAAQRRRELEVVRRDNLGGPAGEVVLERVGGRRSEELGAKRRIDAFDEAQLRRPARLARRRLKRPSREGTKRPGAADGAVGADADQRRLQERRDVAEGV